MKFDPKAKVKQGQFSDAPDGKKPNREQLILIFLNMHLENIEHIEYDKYFQFFQG